MILAGLVFAAGNATDAPEPRTCVGRVVDERRLPVADARVTVRGVPQADPLVVTTAADGSFTFEFPAAAGDDDFDDPGRIWALFVTTADRRVGVATAWFPSKEQKARRTLTLREPIVVAPSGRLDVTVRDADGVVPDATLELHHAYDGNAVTSATTDAQGHAVVDPAPVDEFALFVKKSGRGRATVEARIAAGATTEAVVVLHPLRTLAVEVVDTDSGAPIPGASITATRSADGPNPGAFPRLNRREALFAEPRTTDDRGRLELRDLEAEEMLDLHASAPHYTAYWGHGIPSFQGAHPPRTHVSADEGSIRLEMKKLPRATVKFAIVQGSAPPPPDGTPLTIRTFESGMHWAPPFESPSAVVRGDSVEVTADFPADHDLRYLAFVGWAVATDGPIAELAPSQDFVGGTARFARAAALTVKVVDEEGTPKEGEGVQAWLESLSDSTSTPPHEWSTTDANGVVAFAPLRVGRWIVSVRGITRLVDLDHAEGPFELTLPPPAEVVVEFTIDGMRRLPASLNLWIDSELPSLRREDPERGDVHLFLTQPMNDRALHYRFDGDAVGMRSLALPPFPKQGPLVVPLTWQKVATGEVVARVRGLGSTPNASQTTFVLERQSEESGQFEHPDYRFEFRATTKEEPVERRFSALDPGVWRIAIPEMGMASAPARVVAGGPPAELEFDLTPIASVGVIWSAPAGENLDFLELEGTGWPARAHDWRSWESEWPLAPAERNYTPLRFDRKSPPPLRIHHPYLVGTKWNDAIDLRNPRTAITLHVEAGPLVTFTPDFAASFGDKAPTLQGAFVTLAGSRDATEPAEVRRALKRGDAFVFAPPAAGSYRVLIDPIVAAPVEIEEVAFDGGPRDLGPVRFTAGSTLHVHVRAKPPFAAPRLCVRAVRVDGIPYERASSWQQTAKSPTEPEIRGLGPGLFRITYEGSRQVDGHEWSAEVRVDGVHYAELEIVAE